MSEANEKLNERKSSEEIKAKILEVLNDKPLNALEISRAISSNWSTVKNYINELIEEKKVKETSFGNQVIYQRITEDTYFSIPIKEEDRNMLKFIIYNAINEYKEQKKKQIKKTELAKLVYFVNSELKLNLPIVWYLYGPMPLMILDLQRDYSTTFIPKDQERIKKTIQSWIKNKARDNVRELVKELYMQENAKLYDLKVKIYDCLKNKSLEKLKELSKDFYFTSMASGLDSSEIYKFYNIVSGLHLLKKEENHCAELLLAFDSIWKYIASKTLYNSLKVLKYSNEDINNLLGPVLETKRYLVEETLSNLNEAYNEELPSQPINLEKNNLGDKISPIIDSWIKSEIWRK